MTTCNAPGCPRELKAGNKSGVCPEHTHLFGYCKCKQCQKRKAPAPRPSRAKPAPPPPVVIPEPAPRGAGTVPEWDAPLDELCKPLSAKADPRGDRDWSSGIGSNPGATSATHRARQQASMRYRD